MEGERMGVSPASSERILAGILRVLEARDVFGPVLDPCLARFARTLAPLLPSNLFPDVYLEQPLMGDDRPRAGFALDSFERSYLQVQSAGSYWDHSGVMACTKPACVDTLSGLVCDESSMRAFQAEDHSLPSYQTSELEARLRLSPAGSATPVLRRLLDDLAPLPVRILTRDVGSTLHLTIVLPRNGMRERFENAPYRAALTQALATAGVSEGRLASLARVCLRCATPCITEAYGTQRWISSVDLSHLLLAFRDGRLVGCTAGVRLSDRTVSFRKRAFRPIRFYQWHITDNCDQRCRHCYLFAEDARKRCRSTSLDQLLATLDEVEQRSAELCSTPFLAITGGDPLLHPNFWEFAEELQRRGIPWELMGNPFHLNDEVCRRLHQLGCVQYQLSLDGRRAYHDSLRKPGSFDATIRAIPLLRRTGLNVQLMATASNQNLDEILACMDLASELDVDYFAFARYCATSPQKATELYPTPQEYRAFLLAYYEKRRALATAGSHCDFRLKEHLFYLLRYELGEFKVPSYARTHPNVICDGCHLGAKATIAVNGDLLACPRMDSVAGNICDGSLAEVEEGPAMQTFRAVDAIRGCSDCRLLMWCRGCRAVGFNATGDLQAADPMCWHVIPREA